MDAAGTRPLWATTTGFQLLSAIMLCTLAISVAVSRCAYSTFSPFRAMEKKRQLDALAEVRTQEGS
jgi:hypothetical protein